jgi:LysR family transcriptional activator of nhaA
MFDKYERCTAMINLNQLRCFWAVARAGGVHRASEQLHLTPQTLSGQVSRLEDTLGVQLFERTGRRMVLTEAGRMALSYAEDIFGATRELEEMLRQRPGREHPRLLRVGIADAVPKAIVHSVLAPALADGEPVRLVCREGTLTRLLADLAIHQLDMVLADAPHPAALDIKCYSHLLGKSGIAFLGSEGVMRDLDRQAGFPALLDGAPLLLPGPDTALRGPLMRWLAAEGIRPTIIGEFDDSALMKDFGRAGAGIFPAPAALAAELCGQYAVTEIGRTDALREQFFAITAERRLTDTLVEEVIATARQGLFGHG